VSEPPYFPPPREAKATEAPEAQPEEAFAVEPRAVSRVEAPPSDAAPQPEPAKKPKLSPDEIKALLAVDGVVRPSPFARAAKRGGIVVIPTGLISLLLQLVLGEHAIWVIPLVILGAIAWTARPLFRRDGWS
jgi:hypothetical protein